MSRATSRRKKAGKRPEDCLACPAGYFCPQSATINPKVCGTGSYSVCINAHCILIHVFNLSSFKCPSVKSIRHLNLLVRSFSQDKGSEECLPCLPGHYCSNETTSAEAMLRVMVCPPGFLCSQGLDREPQRSAVFCPIGFYCPGGNVVSTISRVRGIMTIVDQHVR